MASERFPSSAKAPSSAAFSMMAASSRKVTVSSTSASFAPIPVTLLSALILPHHSPNALSPTFSYARLIEFSASALSSKYAGILFVSAIFTYAKKSSIMLLINFSLAWFSFVVGGDSLGPQAHASPAKRTMTQPKPAIFVPERFIVLTSGGSRTSAIPLH